MNSSVQDAPVTLFPVGTKSKMITHVKNNKSKIMAHVKSKGKSDGP